MYWLQGFFEVSGAKSLDEDQTLKIRMKLESCFEKATEKGETTPLFTAYSTAVNESPKFDTKFQASIDEYNSQPWKIPGDNFGYNLGFPQNPFPSCGGVNQPMTTC